MTAGKTLFIVRHGKSSWDNEEISDSDRPLKERGIVDSYTMASRFKTKGVQPEIIFSSPAIRALHTAIIFCQVLNLPEKILQIDGRLLHPGNSDLLKLVSSFDDKYSRIMIFGHNPGFTDLVNSLSDIRLGNLPTTGVAVLEFETPRWSNAGKQTLLNTEIDYPKSEKI